MDKLHQKVLALKNNLEQIPEENFLQKGRNVVLKTSIDNTTVVIKFFKKPHLINQIMYGYFRKSKAKRSFEYASKLTELNIGTPKPISFYENKNVTGLKDSYYVCEYLNADFTFRDLTLDFTIVNFEQIVKEFTKFTFNLHEKGVLFQDHSPGNTLIKKIGENYHFYLVDLNRMEFKPLDFETRMKNFSRITKEEKIINIMSTTYAQLINKDQNLVALKMNFYINSFQEKFFRKKRIKKKLKFWKKK